MQTKNKEMIVPEAALSMKKSAYGMVLLMVLAVLTLLCLIGLMFVLMVNMERATARAYLDMVRGKLVAQSGIHAAIVNTRALLTEKGFDIKEMEYRGEDLNGDGVLTAGLEQYEDQDGDGKLQISDCPIYRAVQPSFMVDLNHDGVLDEKDLIDIAGKKVGVSGIMPGPYNPALGAYYVTKVEDLSGRIFINGIEDPDEKQMLERVLSNLTYELFGKELIGEAIAQEAPYATIDEVKTKLEKRGVKLSEDELTLLKTSITTYAWRDTSVIKPVNTLRRLGNEFGIPPQTGDDIFSWRPLRPLWVEYPTGNGGKKMVGRAPVNINTAPKAVLVALIQDLAGLYLNEEIGFKRYTKSGQFPGIKYTYNMLDDPQKSGPLGRLGYTAAITTEQAREIARAIIQNRQSKIDLTKPWRGTFQSWQQFGLFCDKVLVAGQDFGIPANFLTPQQADVLKANFNPNSNLPEFNPPYQRLFWVGKDNLWLTKRGRLGTFQTTPAYSFEFSFFPTGYFLITSLGRLLGPDNKVLSESEIQTTVQLFSVYRETSQNDFLADFWSKQAPLDEVISRNAGDSFQTTTDNLTLQTYPDILEYDPDTGCRDYCRGCDPSQPEHLRNPYIQDAHYDGYITLATVEDRDINPAPDFRASYSKYGLNADKPVNSACLRDTTGPYQNRLIGLPELTNEERRILKARPGALFPDGVYSELDSVPMYNYRPADIDHFVVSMWLKPHFFPEASARTRVYLTYQVWGANDYGPTAPLGIYNIANDGENYSFGGYNTKNIYKQAWDHTAFIAGGYRTSNQDPPAEITPCLNHIKCGNPNGIHSSYIRDGDPRWGETVFRAGKWMQLGWIHTTEEDAIAVNRRWCQVDYFRCRATYVYTLPKLTSPENILRLGERRSAEALNSVPDSTLDEVIIWESLSDEKSTSVLHDVWQQGRYYRGNDGVFTSRSINLSQHMNLPTGTPITVFIVNWTQYVPEEKWSTNGNRIELPHPGQPGAPTCEIEIWDEHKTTKLGVRKNTTSQPDPSGELIIRSQKSEDSSQNESLVVTEPIRYRVKFIPNVDPLNDILIDPLIFDDITIIYYSVPKFLSWVDRR
jgi:hypothetical protein